MSRRARRGAAASVLTVGLALPAPVAAHALGGTFQLPVPLWLYLVGAAVAVGASFVVTSAVVRRDQPDAPAEYATRPLAVGGSSLARGVLRVLGLAWWYGAIAVGFLVGDISPLPAVLFWIGIWVGLPIIAVLIGNPWPSLSPFRSTFGIVEWTARRVGIHRVDAGLRYPVALARWPAVALLAAAIWAELVLPGRDAAGTVAALMLAYTVLTVVGMGLVGQIAWLRHAELFEVALAWFGRVGALARRSTSPELCEGCGEACDPRRCLDCPECSTAADDGERDVVLRPWIVGLTDVTRAGWSDAAFIVTTLAGVSYDGLEDTAFGASLLSVLLPPVQALFGLTSTTFLVLDTLALVVVIAAFMAAFLVIVSIAHALARSDRRRPLAEKAGVYAATLLPIAGGYVIAHYLTLVIQGAVWLPSLLVDPLMSLAPVLDWIPTALVWYLSVVSIVGGHIAGIVLAHRLAVRDAPSRAVVAGLPMVALMIGYTVLSLWIIAQPIVVEPGLGPGA